MIVRNKKNGTNVLAYGDTKVIIRAGETVDIPDLTDLNEVINLHDFNNRGWFEVVEEKNIFSVAQETNLEKAEKEVKEYTEKKTKED